MIGNYFWGGAAAPYQIEQSLRFSGGSTQYLYRTGAITAQGGVSLWVKFHRDVGYYTAGIYDPIIYLSSGGPWLYRNNYGRLYYRSVSSGGDTTWSGQVCRDHSAWYHIFLKFNSSSSTSLYVNNVLWGTQSTNIGTSSGDQRVGYDGDYLSQFYLAEYHAAFGESLDATDFGEYDDNGVWVPKKFTGNYGSQGFYLKFDPSAANGLGHDHSGNGNHFTDAGGFTTSGTGTDVMSDTPTTNYCTINPLTNISGLSGTISNLSDGNLYHNSNGNTTLPTTLAIPAGTGKWYWEVTPSGQVNSSDWVFGVQRADVNRANYTSWTEVKNNGVLVNTNNVNSVFIYGANSTSTAWTVANGDVVGVAFDASTGNISYYKNGTLQGTLSAAVNTSYPHYPAGSGYFSSEYLTWNFGQRAFAYTPPTGYKALNTANLPAPDIADGSKNFGIKLYQGNEGDVSAPATQTITNLEFAPDFVWIKCRNSGTANHSLFDQVRGTGKTLWSNSSSNEQTNYDRGYLSAFTSDGFTVRAGSTDGRDVNGLGTTGSPPTQYVAWNWKAGGSGSSNTAGSITSTVSANPSAGFSIVSYTGNNTAGATVGHGLGVPPDMMIIKNRNSTYNWVVYHTGLDASAPEDYYILLNDPGERALSTNIWQSTAPTSTTFKIGDMGQVNADNQPYIAYCFAEVEGYSKFGIIKGNYVTDGPFIYLGFTPAFLMFKNAERAGTDWIMMDATRDTYNAADSDLRPSTYDSERTGADRVDFCANGFKIRTDHVSWNGPDDAPGIIYAAFASNPFGGGGVSPATAR